MLVLIPPRWESAALLHARGKKCPTGPREQAHRKRDRLHAPLRGIQPREQDLARGVSLNSPETREQGDVPTSSPHHRRHRGTVYK